MLKNLLGNSTRDRELSAEVRAVLQEMREERERFEKLLATSGDAAETLTRLHEPIAQVGNDVNAANARLEAVQQKLALLDALAGRVEALDASAKELVEHQQAAEAQIASSVEDSRTIRTVFEDLAQKVELADSLKGRMEAFLEVEKPFQLLHDEAEAIRGQIESTSEQLARLREQHDRLVDAHKLGTSKMEALDRRRDELGRDLQDKERRVVDVEHVVREMDGIRQTVNEVKRGMGTLRTLSDSVAQKTAALEAQRETVERSLSQADRLEAAMRQLDAGMRQQQENEKRMVALQEQLKALEAMHDGVLERSTEIAQLETRSAEQITAIHDQLAAGREEVKNAVERFDFEGKGLESVSQRVADLRSDLTEFEGRYRNLTTASETVRDLTSQTQMLAPRIQALKDEVAHIDEDAQQLAALRQGLAEAVRTASSLAAQVTHLEESRPAIAAVLGDIERLAGTHAGVKDAIDLAKVAHGEITRMIASQSETRTWLIDVERTLTEMRNRFGQLETVTPALERAEKQAQHITESLSSIEARRDFLEGLHQKLTEFGSLSAGLNERGTQLAARMDAAEERFIHFASHAQEADKISSTVANVKADVLESVRKTESLVESVTAIEARCASVEELAERTRTLREEIAQRQDALEAAAQDLERAATERAEAAGAAQQLSALAKKLDGALASANKKAAELGVVAGGLESRAAALGGVDQRLGQFEQKLARWEIVDQQLSRALEQIAARQGTVQSLGADLERMFAIAETTCENVRTITSASRETAESRQLLKDIAGRLAEIKDLAGSLDERERQMGKAEERLARAEGFLGDVRSGLESLQGQKTLVDQAVKKVSALKFLLKQADAMIENLRDERRMTSDVQEAMATDDDAADDESGVARAA